MCHVIKNVNLYHCHGISHELNLCLTDHANEMHSNLSGKTVFEVLFHPPVGGNIDLRK